MKEDSTGVSPVIATILLIAITVVAVGIVMAFVAGLGTPTRAPVASLSVTDKPGPNAGLYLRHNGGDDIVWSDVEISVTENVDSAPVYTAPANVGISTTGGSAAGRFKVGEYVTIDKQSTSGTPAVTDDNWYHIMIRHLPSGSVLLNVNQKPTSA